MKQHIHDILEDLLPYVDWDSDFLFSELDSLGITTVMMTLSKEYGVELDATDVTPKNFKNLDNIVRMVQGKLAQPQ